MAKKIAGRGGAGRGQGRKLEYSDGKVTRLNVTLDQMTVDIAKAVGGGKVSTGLRLATRQVCRVRRHNDQMLCGLCGIAYDVGDPDVPPCGMAHALDFRPPRLKLTNRKGTLHNPILPVDPNAKGK